jgi:hypothetical protein
VVKWTRECGRELLGRVTGLGKIRSLPGRRSRDVNRAQRHSAKSETARCRRNEALLYCSVMWSWSLNY